MGIKKIIINGTTPFSIVIKRIIEQEGGDVLCFTTLKKFITDCIIDSLPVIATELISEKFNLDEVEIVNTVGYTKMNTVREKAQKELDEFGLKTVSFISSKACIYTDKIGRGTIVMPGAFIGPDVKIGECNIIYSNTSLTHHVELGNYNFIASGCVLGGNIKVYNNCFIGLNSTLRNRLVLPSYTLIGCASNVVKPILEENTVWFGNPAKLQENKKALDIIIK